MNIRCIFGLHEKLHVIDGNAIAILCEHCSYEKKVQGYHKERERARVRGQYKKGWYASQNGELVVFAVKGRRDDWIRDNPTTVKALTADQARIQFGETAVRKAKQRVGLL